MTWTQVIALVDAYGPIVGFIVAVVLLIVLLRKAWPTITQFVTSVNTVATLPAKLTSIDNKLTAADTRLSGLEGTVKTMAEDMAHVKHEVQTNSGGSLKDSAKVTERGVKSLQGSMRNLSGRVGKLESGQQLAAKVATQRAAVE